MSNWRKLGTYINLQFIINNVFTTLSHCKLTQFFETQKRYDFHANSANKHQLKKSVWNVNNNSLATLTITLFEETNSNDNFCLNSFLL